MPRLALDSVNFRALSATRWPHLIGYANGHVSAWSTEEISHTRAAGQLLALVDVLGNSPLSASILDYERGDVQSPTVVRAWAQARNQYRGDATLYVAPANISRAISDLRGEPLNLIVVDLTADGEPPFEVPAYPGLPANVRVIGRQFVFGPKSGGDYDMTVIYADDWHPEQHEPARYTAAALAAAPELGRYAATVAAAVAAGQLPGQLDLTAAAADPKPEGSPAGTTSSAPLSEEQLQAPAPAPAPAADVSTSPAMAEAAADTAGPVQAFAAAAAPVPVIHDDSTNAAIAAASSPPAPDSSASSPSSSMLTVMTGGATSPPLKPLRGLPDAAPVPAPVPGWQSSATGERLLAPVDADPLFAEHELAAARRAVTAAAGPAENMALNHDFIKSTLHDIGDVAAMFRRGGWASTAAELERVAGIAWEVGSALKTAGF